MLLRLGTGGLGRRIDAGNLADHSHRPLVILWMITSSDHLEDIWGHGLGLPLDPGRSLWTEEKDSLSRPKVFLDHIDKEFFSPHNEISLLDVIELLLDVAYFRRARLGGSCYPAFCGALRQNEGGRNCRQD